MGDSNPNSFVNKQSVCIIGGGVSGIVTLRALLSEGFDATLFEARSRVGGVWATGYVGQGAQSPSWFYEFSDFPVGDKYPLFMKKEDICNYIDDYVAHFKLASYIHCNVTVEGLDNPKGKGWRVTTQDGQERIFDKVVICTGLFRKTTVPQISDMDHTKVEVYHSSDCSDRSALAGKDVVFVGYGKSTLDLMYELKDDVKSTTFLFREKRWPLPNNLWKISIIHRHGDIWVMFCRAFAWVLPAYYTEDEPRSLLYRMFTTMWWWIWGHIVDWQHGLSAADMRPQAPYAKDIFHNQFVVPEGTYQRMASREIKAKQATIVKFKRNSILLDTGEELQCDAVVFGTGFEAAMEIIPEQYKKKLVCENGEGPWLYRHIVHPEISDLGFVGWASTNVSISSSTLQALWLAAFWRGRIIATSSDMRNDISKYRRWAQENIPATPQRPCTIFFYINLYHDQLIEDLGISKYLHGGVLDDFQLYYPATYRSLVQELSKTPS